MLKINFQIMKLILCLVLAVVTVVVCGEKSEKKSENVSVEDRALRRAVYDVEHRLKKRLGLWTDNDLIILSASRPVGSTGVYTFTFKINSRERNVKNVVALKDNCQATIIQKNSPMGLRYFFEEVECD